MLFKFSSLNKSYILFALFADSYDFKIYCWFFMSYNIYHKYLEANIHKNMRDFIILYG